jgi:hypothetical protein
MLALIAYNEYEEVNYTPAMKVSQFTFVAQRDGKCYTYLQWHCLCGQLCKLVQTLPGANCKCKRLWNGDHVGKSVLLLVGRGGLERTR